ncbi:hypothetical protein FNF31_05356 [Cafeteria roenbergensis]|uniref:Uncharacterized protein n=1 Tax=Cafeteria roenbergensis TaxID=33653 RepID=A0A5A8D2B4_CAFRO|nr:hypothetical protein FNF31_05356 [Cafeteria roenbergensis]
MALVLDRGADLEAKNMDGDTALLLAARNGKVEAMALLLDRGADLEAKNSAGKAAMEWVKAEHLKALVLHVPEHVRRARERERASCADAVAAKQAEMDAQADAAQAYRAAAVAAMAALEHRVKQLEDLAQLL